MRYYIISRAQMQFNIPGVSERVTRERFTEVGKRVFYSRTVQNLISERLLNYKITETKQDKKKENS